MDNSPSFEYYVDYFNILVFLYLVNNWKWISSDSSSAVPALALKECFFVSFSFKKKTKQSNLKVNVLTNDETGQFSQQKKGKSTKKPIVKKHIGYLFYDIDVILRCCFRAKN